MRNNSNIACMNSTQTRCIIVTSRKFKRVHRGMLTTVLNDNENCDFDLEKMIIRHVTCIVIIEYCILQPSLRWDFKISSIIPDQLNSFMYTSWSY